MIKQVIEYIEKTAQIAANATCKRSKCGSIIVKNGEIIGTGFNSPLGNLESQRRCTISKDSYNKKVTNKTCCIHAEQKAILDALKKNPDKVKNPNRSNLALDVGIKEFALWHDEGICIYETDEYNTLSYQYSE